MTLYEIIISTLLLIFIIGYFYNNAKNRNKTEVVYSLNTIRTELNNITRYLSHRIPGIIYINAERDLPLFLSNHPITYRTTPTETEKDPIQINYREINIFRVKIDPKKSEIYKLVCQKK